MTEKEKLLKGEGYNARDAELMEMYKKQESYFKNLTENYQKIQIKYYHSY